MLGLIATVAQLDLRLSSKVIAWPRYLLVRVGLGFWSISMYYTFFYKQPYFSVEPRVAIGSAQNEAESCYEVAAVFWRL